MFNALFTLNTTTEVRPLSKTPNTQLLPGRRSINGCPLLRVCVHGVCVHGVCVFTAVCVHFGWVNCRAQIPSMGNHTWPHVTSLSLLFNFDLPVLWSIRNPISSYNAHILKSNQQHITKSPSYIFPFFFDNPLHLDVSQNTRRYVAFSFIATELAFSLIHYSYTVHIRM